MTNNVQTISSSSEEEDDDDGVPLTQTKDFTACMMNESNSRSFGKTGRNDDVVSRLLPGDLGENSSGKRNRSPDETHDSFAKKKARFTDFPTGSKDRQSSCFSAISQPGQNISCKDSNFRHQTSLPSSMRVTGYLSDNVDLSGSPKRTGDFPPPMEEMTSPVFNTRRPTPISRNQDVVELSSSDSDDSFIWDSSQIVVPANIPKSIDLDDSDEEDTAHGTGLPSPDILQDVSLARNAFIHPNIVSQNSGLYNQIQVSTRSAYNSGSSVVPESCFSRAPLRRQLDSEKSGSLLASKSFDPTVHHLRRASNSTLKIPVVIAPSDDDFNFPRSDWNGREVTSESVVAPVQTTSKSIRITPLSMAALNNSDSVMFSSPLSTTLPEQTSDVPSGSRSSSSALGCSVFLDDVLNRNGDGFTSSTNLSSRESLQCAFGNVPSLSVREKSDFRTLLSHESNVSTKERSCAPTTFQSRNNSDFKFDSDSRMLHDNQLPSGNLSSAAVSTANKSSNTSVQINLLSAGIDPKRDVSGSGGESFWSDEDLFEDYALTQADEAIDTALKNECQVASGVENNGADTSDDMLYSQQDGTIIIDDSDDELFANLTQAFMDPATALKSDGHDSDTIDEGWNDDDDVDAAAMLEIDESCFIVGVDDDFEVEMKDSNSEESQPLISAAEFAYNESKLSTDDVSDRFKYQKETESGGNHDRVDQVLSHGKGLTNDCNFPESLHGIHSPDDVSKSAAKSQTEKETKSMMCQTSDIEDDVPIFDLMEKQRTKVYLSRNLRSEMAVRRDNRSDSDNDCILPKFDSSTGLLVMPDVRNPKTGSVPPILEFEVDDQYEFEPEARGDNLTSSHQTKRKRADDEGAAKNPMKESKCNYWENLETSEEVLKFYDLNNGADTPWLSKTSPVKVKAPLSDLSENKKQCKKKSKTGVSTKGRIPQEQREEPVSAKQDVKIAQLRNSVEQLRKVFKSKSSGERKDVNKDVEMDRGIQQAKIALKERKRVMEKEKNAKMLDESSSKVAKVSHRRHTFSETSLVPADTNQTLPKTSDRLPPSGEKMSPVTTPASANLRLSSSSSSSAKEAKNSAVPNDRSVSDKSTRFKIPLKKSELAKTSEMSLSGHKDKCSVPNTRVRESSKSVQDPAIKNAALSSSCSSKMDGERKDKRSGDSSKKIAGEITNSKSIGDSSGCNFSDLTKVVSKSESSVNSLPADSSKKPTRDSTRESKKLVPLTDTSRSKSSSEKSSKSTKPSDHSASSSSSSDAAAKFSSSVTKAKFSVSIPNDGKDLSIKCSVSAANQANSTRNDRSETHNSAEAVKRVDRKDTSSVRRNGDKQRSSEHRSSEHRSSGHRSSKSSSVSKSSSSTKSITASKQSREKEENVKAKDGRSNLADSSKDKNANDENVSNRDVHLESAIDSVADPTIQSDAIPAVENAKDKEPCASIRPTNEQEINEDPKHDHLPSKETESLGCPVEMGSSADQLDVAAAGNMSKPDESCAVQPSKKSNSKNADCVTLSQIVNDSIRRTGPMLPPPSFPAPRKITLQGQGQTVKDRARESVKLSDLPKAKVGCSSLPIDSFVASILLWNPVWMKECETVKIPPPIINYDKAFPLLDTYDSFSDYANILQPLMLLEIWESMIKDWKDRRKNKSVFQVLPTFLNIQKERNFMFLHCQGLLATNNSTPGQQLKENDLIILSLRAFAIPPKGQPPDPSTVVVKPVFGIISKMTRHFPTKTPENFNPKIDELRRQSGGKSIVVTYVIQFLCRKHPIDNSEFINIELVTSILPAIRQFSGVANLPKSPLAAEILRPSQREVFYHNLKIDANELKERFNEFQSDTIARVTRSVSDPYFPPKVCLLQGPPGTGKSYTIIGLVDQLLRQNNNIHILLCAPSNAGIDEICRRLINHNRQEKPPANRRPVNFVRLGAMSSVHRDVQPYTLQIQAKALFDRQQKVAPGSVLSTLKNLEQKQKEYNEKLEMFTNQNNAQEVENLCVELRLIEKRKEVIEKGLKKLMTPSDEIKMKKQVLTKADVVCTTLNHSGSSHVVESLHHDGKIHFGCIIVDEACQCTEVDCLIPLQYRASKLVLVGDPNQLPPTVLSRKAAELNYGQSLFERLYNQLKGNDPSPVLMLRTQYRMHPDICAFSSRHFYRGLVKTDPNTAKKRSNFPWHPYTVFDVQFSQEKVHPSNTSSTNPEEAEFIVQLCVHLATLMTAERASQNIGIITPYQGQKMLIINLLKQRCQELESIEVGTVDGFQGREKDVIIVSCVRSNLTSKIGFLADHRRLNVSITRAKYALYAVGNLKTLMVNPDWAALVKDACQRGRVVKVNSPQQTLSQIRFGCSKSPTGSSS